MYEKFLDSNMQYTHNDQPTLGEILRKLDEHVNLIAQQGESLEEIKRSLHHLSVQDKEIKHLRQEHEHVRKKVETLTANDGTISKIQSHQASCPREQIKVLWYVIVPIAFTQFLTAVTLMAKVF